jgi:Flp pilus assembly protein TadD
MTLNTPSCVACPHLHPQINAGKCREAVATLDGVLAASPKEVGARVARGTARALLRDLAGACEDFDVAIQAEPT